MESKLLSLPAEIRVKIIDYLIQRPLYQTISHPHQEVARKRGLTDGVGHATLVREGNEWRSVSVARPPGLKLTSTAILRTCRLLYNEAMDLLFHKCLFVINIQNMRLIAPPFLGARPSIIAGPNRDSVFLRWITHVHIRQHIRPEEDLMQKASTLQSLLACLSPERKSTGLTLHFDSMWLVNDGEWPCDGRPEYIWQLYAAELARMPIGADPQVRVSTHWMELEGKERFGELSKKTGGYVRRSLKLIIPEADP